MRSIDDREGKHLNTGTGPEENRVKIIKRKRKAKKFKIPLLREDDHWGFGELLKFAIYECLMESYEGENGNALLVDYNVGYT